MLIYCINVTKPTLIIAVNTSTSKSKCQWPSCIW